MANPTITEELDAKARQRQQSVLLPFKFPNSGRQLLIRQVSPYLLADVAQSINTPQPPIVSVNYGTEDAPNIKQESNFADPEYRQAMERYEFESEELLRSIMIEVGVHHKLTPEEKAEVEQIKTIYKRRKMEERLKGRSDLFIYVSLVCVQGQKDMEALQTALAGASFSKGNKNPEVDNVPEAEVQG